ncbi:type II toxin-antitoxin system HicB family antitoxin [Xenorhabdus sp. PB62.4]|uniref:type II toxin-antitoxin system HicB family antitoxin n=1 Tax=Xenorhabdus sp. PB62.4 TaxID=1851573 RepID=UPI002107C46D|nr:type II toxin-antitoxin system HicB family antitoxin [Xenorhabdus sp. PB62.4]MBC8952831.1 DNA repair protein [Xenorhabdus sp. PB62.4]
MMNNTLKIDGHTAVISFDPEIEMFRGEFIGLNGGADFYAYSVDELKKEGAISLTIFLDECKKDNLSTNF